jgi:hypothetical protein
MIEILLPHRDEIAALEPAGQKFEFARFLPIYHRLFDECEEWRTTQEYLEDADAISREDLWVMSAAAHGGAISWSSLFMATMIWGFGAKDERGPVKIFLAIHTPGAAQIISDTVACVYECQLAEALVSIRRLDEIGTSFGTKFLYAAGLGCLFDPKPYVLDSKVIKALRHGLGENVANDRFGLSAVASTHKSGIETAANGYANYCSALKEWANGLGDGINPEQLELFLFQNSDTF